jgi:hypothetical protein
MISLRLTCLAITAVVPASGITYLSAQTTRVADTDTGTKITSLTQVRRPHGAPTALDVIQANTDVSVDLNVLLAPQMTDAAAANGAQSRGGSAHARSTNSQFLAASRSGSSPSGVSNVTSFNQMTKGPASFGASPSTMRPATPSLRSSSQIQRGGSLPAAAPAGASSSDLPRFGNGLPDSARSRIGRNLVSKPYGSRTPSIPVHAATENALARSASTDGQQASNVDDQSGTRFFEVFEDPFSTFPKYGFERLGMNQGREKTCGEACGSPRGGKWAAFGAHGSEQSSTADSGLSEPFSRLSRLTFGRASRRPSGTGQTSTSANQKRRGFMLEPDSRK